MIDEETALKIEEFCEWLKKRELSVFLTVFEKQIEGNGLATFNNLRNDKETYRAIARLIEERLGENY